MTRISMQATDRLEIGFGRVHEGSEAWMVGEYFPKMGPVMAQHGMRTLLPFVVVTSNVEGMSPLQGTLACWPSAQHRRDFHADPDFLAIRPQRDAALELSGGHLFESFPHAVELPVDGDYALVIAEPDVVPEQPLFQSSFAPDSPTLSYAGRSLSLHRWSDACERLLADSSTRAVVLRVRLNVVGPT